MEGVIKRIVKERGFGFIKDAKGNEYFFHKSTLSGTAFEELAEGMPMVFDWNPTPKGPRAENVRRAE